MKFEKFHYDTIEDIKNEMLKLNVSLPLSENTEILRHSLDISNFKLENRIAIQPMEGCDGTFDGRPGELTERRYMRFAKSGAALIWFEATAVVNEGRANPNQLMINKTNLDSFRLLVEKIKNEGYKKNGFEPFVICQLTHSGRYSKPEGIKKPLIAYHNPVFEENVPVDDSAVVTDGYLKSLEEKFAEAAFLCKNAGFDGVDIKCCHRYLMSELVSAFMRKGEYGGSFENRTRLYINSVKNAKSITGGKYLITSRLNLYDGFAYPNGFGVNKNGGTEPDMSEPLKLVGILHKELGIELLNFTIGNPYFNPYVNRPYDGGVEAPPEHPLEGVARMFDCIGAVSKAFPGLAVISSGHSYLRQFSPYLAAGVVERGVSKLAGFGREAFAYPDFPGDVLNNAVDAKKCCITCGKCTELMRAGSAAGCVVKDSEIYLPLYKEYCMKRKEM